jgi:site-specific DNA-methyltransferase (cytosine-N4-specific)
LALSNVRDIYSVEYLKPSGKNKSSESDKLKGIDLAFKGELTQHSTHALHTYVAAINPPLVKNLIKTYVPPNENILDPYCGGGGVLVESIISGRNCAGGEINPLAVIISKAKTTHVSKDTVLRIGSSIIEQARQLINNVNIDLIDKKIKFWFKDETLLEISALRNALENLVNNNDAYSPLFKTIFSATIRDVMLTYRGEVRLRRLVGADLEKFNPDTFNSFGKRVKVASDRVSALPRDIECDIQIRDIRKLPFQNNEFHTIITSPPYADDKNGVGYFQFSKNMLHFLGYDDNKIKEYKNLFHGSVKEDKKPLDSASLNKSLLNVKKNSEEKYIEAVAFYHDYEDGLKEMARVTNKWIIIVIGNRVLSRTEFDNVSITIEIFDKMGIHLQDHLTRELKKKRIPNLGGDGGGINLEHILVFKK